MILKAGTYRFNDVITYPLSTDESIAYNIDFVCNNTTYNQFSFSYQRSGSPSNPHIKKRLYYYNLNASYPDSAYEWITNNVVVDAWVDEASQNITLATDQTVPDTFGTWYISNTNYNEVNAKPLATIEYNGQTIAQLNAGETATIKCAEKRMITDIVIKINS